MVNYEKVANYRKKFQSKTFPELNSKKHTVTNCLIFTKLRNCAKLEFRKSGIGQFCAKWLLQMIAQIVVFFSRKTDAQRKKNFAFWYAKIAQKFCEWKPYKKSWVNKQKNYQISTSSSLFSNLLVVFETLNIMKTQSISYWTFWS